MLPNQRYTVLDSREVPRGRPVSVLRTGEQLVFSIEKMIVETQQPQETDLPFGEHWIPGDELIILYRRHRRVSLDAAGIPEKL
jgi:hypothetical protein